MTPKRQVTGLQHHLTMPTPRRMSCFGLLVLMLTGCDPTGNITGPNTAASNSATIEQADTDFRVALSFLDNFHEYERFAATERILYHLQKWVEIQEPDPDWIADPLYKQLPSRFDRMKGPTALSKLQFSSFDILILREAMWARDLSMQIRQRPLGDVRLAKWLKHQEDSLEESALGDLETVTRLCDWIVRNIQIEPVRTGEGQPAAGAWYLPGESLLLGRGDWLIRSRIAILLARQVGIPLVMLGIEQEDGAPQPWCLGALISGQIYLFDMRFGMPVPDGDGRGIARLEQVVENPHWLEQLSDPDGEAYPVKAEDLHRVVAMIDATPEYLSQRMKLIEAFLPDEKRLTLTSAPSPLRQELRKCKGVGSNVSLWSVPYDAYLYRQNALSKNTLPENLIRIQNQLAILDGQAATPLAMARRQHFRGNFIDSDSEKGAKAYYLTCRVPEADLEKMEDTERFSRIVGNLRQLPEDKVARMAMIDAARRTLRVAKSYASYWLGLIAFDEGHYTVAENYLAKRTLQASPEGPWTVGATYNLARTYEQIGLLNEDEAALAKAHEFFLKDADSPQAPGNRVRAARLKR